MRGKSCLTNLLDFYEDVTSAVDGGETGGCGVFGFPKGV